jgi:hypothetical protein
MLKASQSVWSLISDFYPGYDAVPCRQQKCWVHLIRNLNSDLLSAPGDTEFEHFVIAVRNLLIPIMEAIQTYGLKQRHLHKFQKAVDTFYEAVIMKRYTSEVATKYQERFLRFGNGFGMTDVLLPGVLPRQGLL